MKRILAIFMLLLPAMVMAQSTGNGYSGGYFKATNYMKSPIYFIGASDTASTKAYVRSNKGGTANYFNALQYMRSPIYFQSTTDTLATQAYARLHGGGTSYTIGFGLGLSGSTLYNSRYWKNQDTLKTTLTGVPYLTNGVISIYNDIETNVTSGTTRLGRFTGTTEDESSNRSNVFIGNSSGSHVTTGSDNTFIGTATGTALTTGNNNVFLGRSSGFSATGNYNVMLGNFSGYSATGSSNTCVGYSSGTTFTTGSNNTLLGNYSGHDATGSSNVFLGNYSGYYETGSNKLFIDNQNRTDEATSRTNSLVYGVFNATPASQTLRINGKVGVLKAPTYALDVTGDVNVTGSFLVNGSPQLSITGSTNSTTKTAKVGINAGYSENETATRNNVFMGTYSGEYTTTGTGNTYLGFSSGNISTTGSNNTYIGNLSGVNASGSNNLFIGANSGQYLAGAGTPRSNRLLIGMLDAGSEAGDTTKQLVYGYQDVLPSKSRITLNGKLYQNGELRDTANASHAGFMSKYSYNKLNNSSWATTGNDIYNSNIGNVGIGTSNPLYKLDLIGNSRFTTPAIDDTSAFLVYDPISSAYVLNIDNQNGVVTVDKYNKGNYLVGIGINPSYKLHVNGSINGTSYYLNGVLKSNQFHDSLTIGTSNGLTRTGKQVLNLGLSSATTTGALSSTDWGTFNSKIEGSGTANYVAKFTASGTIGNSSIQTDGIYTGIGIAPNSSYIARFGSGDVLFGGAIKGITYGTASNYWQVLQTNTTASVATGFSTSVSSSATPTVPERSSPALVMLARAYKTSDLSSQPNTMIVRVRGISGTTTSGALTIENSYVDGVANSNEVARFTTGGNLGIGITSPQNMLHINNGANATYTQFTNTATGSTATDGSKIGIESDGDLAIVQQENDSIKLFTNSTLAASINGSGYISYKSSFADISVVGNVTAQSIPSGTTYTKITAYTTNGESSNCTADAANDKITITKAGRYMITASSSSYSGNAGVTFTFRLFAGGTAISTIAPSERKFATANDIFGGVMQGFYNASSVPVDIDVRCIHDSGTSQNITVKHSNLNVEYIGE